MKKWYFQKFNIVKKGKARFFTVISQLTPHTCKDFLSSLNGLSVWVSQLITRKTADLTQGEKDIVE